ncbi:MAG: pseudouridine synthase, partial [Gammaproteobacteria bacterium]
MGLGSRREIEDWIAAGRLTVDGAVATLGQRIRAEQAVALDGKPLYTETRRVPRIVHVLNKPAGTVCTRRDPEGRPTVFELFPRALARQLVAVGRLDFNTAGLLIFTTDGELAHRLMHPSYGVMREYAVRIFGRVEDAVLARLREGVDVDGERLAFDEAERQAGGGINEWYVCRLKTGRNREVRRLWESQGLTVSRLIRVRFGPLTLPRRLPTGRHAPVSGAELEALYHAVGLMPPAPSSPATPRAPRGS